MIRALQNATAGAPIALSLSACYVAAPTALGLIGWSAGGMAGLLPEDAR